MRTKKTKRMRNLMLFFSLMCSFGPLIYYLAISFSIVESTAKKCVIGVSFIVCLMLIAAGTFIKHSMRSPLFVVLLTLYYVIGSIGQVIIVVSIGVILDEFIFSPLYRHYRDLYKINKEIDRRDAA